MFFPPLRFPLVMSSTQILFKKKHTGREKKLFGSSLSLPLCLCVPAVVGVEMSSKLVSSSVKAEGGRPSSTKLQPSVDPKEEEIHMDEEEIQDDEEEAHRVSKKVHAPEQGPPRRRFERDEQSPTSSPSGSRHENSPPHHYDSPSSSRSNSSSYTPPGQGYSRGGGYGMPHYDRSAAMARPDMNPRLAPHHPRPGPPEMNPTWRTPSSPLLRKGKWTAEEEAYVERIILDFSRGFLALPSGTTLRGYLSEKLNW